ncbi:transcription factor GATA-3-like protein [Sarcoptes scabiei]|uniref:Transcription factor GATA-3-like protein n=1 Tax=Sarcoptes scabiei TaxID=52283 RepID=A0A132AEB3_SARSC|nr:transcription factor GATA-3-like protein [Sarcoptes scabiei]
MQHQLTMVEQTNAIEQLSPTSFSSSVSSDLSVINVKSISLSSETNTTPTASSSMPLIHNHSILAEQSSIGSIHPYNYHYATYVEQQQQQQHSSDENLSDQHEHRICYNCRTTHTPLWRRFGPNQFLCNACGLYQRVNGQHRPLVRNIRRLSTTNKRVGLICANCGTKATSMWRRNSSGDSTPSDAEGNNQNKTPPQRKIQFNATINDALFCRTEFVEYSRPYEQWI